ncbi:hypothetical protein K2173_007770 [Erythroxylum novogranatense]|uniref:Uncharacterized protein n=1 Tax=Erythroxylum novogranatense TaxID=1862640 RepID=A0AAV8TCT0_9ROSI|nr:hypothetical protein K2173_007770 [Erythroxylum novogranatense]
MIIASDYVYRIILANKGLCMKYSKIPNALVAIDLSSNGFQGEIPSSIGLLKMDKVLNFSKNNFSGSIPSNFGGLTNLESLDLSQNTIAGRIPPQLTQLTFLAYFNVSYNQLEGPLPQGRQFDTFETSSYIDCEASVVKKMRRFRYRISNIQGRRKRVFLSIQCHWNNYSNRICERICSWHCDWKQIHLMEVSLVRQELLEETEMKMGTEAMTAKAFD